MKKAAAKKAAMGWNEMLVLISVALVILVIFGIWNPLQAAVEQGTDVQVCLATVRAASSSYIGNLVEINCPTQYITLKADGAYVRSVRTSTSQRFLTTAEMGRRLENQGVKSPTESQKRAELASYIIAQQMATCWQAFGEGTLDPFKSRVFVTEDRCVTCAVLSFDTSFIDQNGPDAVDLKAYLQKTKMPDGKATYYNYLRPTLEETWLGIENVLNSPMNAFLSDAAGNPVVQVFPMLKFYEPLVITYVNKDWPILAKWGQTKAAASVIAWPLSARPSCDALG